MRWTEEQFAALMDRRAMTGALIPAPPGVASTCQLDTRANSATTTAKRPKYLNQKTIDSKGIVHDGKGECERWQELQLLERAGAITRLRRQVVYAFVDAGVLITTYKADFDYYDGAAHIVEDHKSPRTRKLAAYRHKVKLMQAHYGIQIREVTK